MFPYVPEYTDTHKVVFLIRALQVSAIVSFIGHSNAWKQNVEVGNDILGKCVYFLEANVGILNKEMHKKQREIVKF